MILPEEEVRLLEPCLRSQLGNLPNKPPIVCNKNVCARRSPAVPQPHPPPPVEGGVTGDRGTPVKIGWSRDPHERP